MIEKDPSIRTQEDFAHALRRFMAGPRLISMVIVLIGVAMVLPPVRALFGGSITPGWVVIGLGWGIYAYVTVQRWRWAKLNRIEG